MLFIGKSIGTPSAPGSGEDHLRWWHLTKDRWGLAGEKIAASSAAETSLPSSALEARHLPDPPVLCLLLFSPHHPNRPPPPQQPQAQTGSFAGLGTTL